MIKKYRQPGFSIVDLGCKSYYDDPTFDNAPILQDWIDRAGTTMDCAIYVPGGHWRIDSTLVIPNSAFSIRFNGNGHTSYLSDLQHSIPTIGGPASRFVWHGNSTDPMMRLQSAGLVLDGIVFEGYQAPLVAEIKADSANYAACGLLVETQQNGIGTGKVYCPVVTFAGLKVGVQMGESDVNADNADNFIAGFILFDHCVTGIWMRNRQSVGHTIQHLKFRGRPLNNPADQTLFRVDSGGKISVETLVMLVPDATVFRTDFVDVNTNFFKVGNLLWDNNAAGSKVVNMVSGSSAMFDIRMHVGNTIATKPLFVLRGPSSLHLHDSYGLYENMVQGYVSSGTPATVLSNCVFRQVSNVQQYPDQIAVQESVATTSLVYSSCREANGALIA